MEKKQTSVESLIENLKVTLPKSQFNDWLMQDLFKQAKAMHKEEIQYAYWEGGMDKPKGSKECEHYYNETYGQTKN